MQGPTMTTMSETDDVLAKQAGEIQNVVDGCRRAMADLDVDAKRRVLTEIDRWVSLEGASHQTPQ
jgi:hypothetical protein